MVDMYFQGKGVIGASNTGEAGGPAVGSMIVNGMERFERGWAGLGWAVLSGSSV